MSQCNSLLVHCMDFRFIKGIQSYMSENGLIGDCDLVSVAGAVKNISDPSDSFDAPFVMKQVSLSHDLHHVKKVVLMHHLDCGAYGGAKAFSSAEAEYAKHVTDLKAASEMIKQKYSELEILLVIAKLMDDGTVTFENIV